VGRQTRDRDHESALVARCCSPAKLLSFPKLAGTPQCNDARRCHQSNWHSPGGRPAMAPCRTNGQLSRITRSVPPHPPPCSVGHPGRSRTVRLRLFGALIAAIAASRAPPTVCSVPPSLVEKPAERQGGWGGLFQILLTAAASSWQRPPWRPLGLQHSRGWACGLSPLTFHVLILR
jgi:hypothetical protein